jgi:UDP-N-acetylmuramyl-tripeptide synthetase
MVGKFNVSNLLAAMAAMRAMNLPLEAIVSACADLEPVPGRMDALTIDGLPMVVVDYAHTPDALEKVLTALQPVALGRRGQLWCVFGCGGDRDRTKRPLMAAMAEKYADRIVVTSDNPRTENPRAIIDEVLAGLKRRDAARIESDRAVAIHSTLSRAMPQDVVLLAGKGHEAFQEIDGAKLPFSDLAQAQAALTARAAAVREGRPA